MHLRGQRDRHPPTEGAPRMRAAFLESSLAKSVLILDVLSCWPVAIPLRNLSHSDCPLRAQRYSYESVYWLIVGSSKKLRAWCGGRAQTGARRLHSGPDTATMCHREPRPLRTVSPPVREVTIAHTSCIVGRAKRQGFWNTYNSKHLAEFDKVNKGRSLNRDMVSSITAFLCPEHMQAFTERAGEWEGRGPYRPWQGALIVFQGEGVFSSFKNKIRKVANIPQSGENCLLGPHVASCNDQQSSAARLISPPSPAQLHSTSSRNKSVCVSNRKGLVFRNTTAMLSP